MLFRSNLQNEGSGRKALRSTQLQINLSQFFIAGRMDAHAERSRLYVREDKVSVRKHLCRHLDSSLFVNQPHLRVGHDPSALVNDVAADSATRGSTLKNEATECGYNCD